MNTDVTVLLEIDWHQIFPLILPILLFNFLLIGIALLDWFKRKKHIAAPYVWLVVIVCMQTVGPIAYLIVGRRVIRHDHN